jgi:hypothetical protein
MKTECEVCGINRPKEWESCQTCNAVDFKSALNLAWQAVDRARYLVSQIAGIEIKLGKKKKE